MRNIISAFALLENVLVNILTSKKAMFVGYKKI